MPVRVPKALPGVFGPVAAPHPEDRAFGLARHADAAAGHAIARRPGVRAALKPAPAPRTPAARRAVQRQVHRAATDLGLSAQDRHDVAASRTPAGKALRQAQRAQNRDAGVPTAATPRAREGKPHARFGIGPASIDTTAASSAVARFAASHVTNGAGAGLPGAVKVAGNAVKDVRDFPKGMVQALYEVGAGGVEAAQGRPQRIKRVGKGFTTGVVGQLAGAGAALARGDTARASKDARGAVKTFGEHPVFGALEFTPVYGVAGRAVGAAGRVGLLGKAGRAAASTKRASRVAAPGIEIKRSYSKNFFTNQASKGRARRLDASAKALAEDDYNVAIKNGKTHEQALAIKRHTQWTHGSRGFQPTVHRPALLRTKVRDANGNRVLDAKGKKVKERRQVPINGRERAIQKHADEFAGYTEAARRHDRTSAQIAGRRALPTKRKYNLADRETGRLRRTRTVAARSAAAVDRQLGRPRVQIHPKVPGIGGKVAAVRPENHVARFVIEQVTRKADVLSKVRAERARLEEVYRKEGPSGTGTLKSRSLRLNRENVAAMDALLKHPQAATRADRLWEAAQRYDKSMRPLTDELVRTKSLDRSQAQEAVLRPLAVGQLGGRFDPSKRVRPHEAAAAAAARAGASTAAERLRVADKAVESAQVARGKASGAAGARRGPASAAKMKIGRAAPTRARAVTAYIKSVEDAAASGVPTGRVAPAVARAARVAEADKARVKAATMKVAHAKAARGVARKALVDAENVAHAARAKPKVVGLVDEHGTPLRPEEIGRRLAADNLHNGPHERLPTFVGQSDKTLGAKAGYVSNATGRQKADSLHRTGEATRVGAVSHDPVALAETMMRSQGVVSAVRAWDGYVSHVGIRGPDGKAFTPDEAAAVIAQTADDGVHYTAVRESPSSYSPEASKQIHDVFQSGLPMPDEMRYRLTGNLFENAVVKSDELGGGDRNVVLVPTTHLNRMIDHMSHQAGDLEKLGQKVTAIFRGTVLPFSVKWLTGNVVEAVLRLGAEGTVPGRDALIGRRLVKAMIQQDLQRTEAARRGAGSADAFQHRTTTGLQFGTQSELGVHRTADMFSSHRVQQAGHAGAAIADLPPIHMALAGLHGYQALVFGMNKSLENELIRHAIGKEARRQVQEMSGSWFKSLKMGDAAMQDLAKGLLDSDAQAAFARSIDGVLGQYTRFSPMTKRIIQSAAPFLPWYLNAVKFVYYTLPHGHPIKTALLARTEQTFEQDWAESNKDTPPGDLTSALRTKGGGYLNVARYTPFGAFTGRAPGIALDPFLPQISSVWEIAHGRSWTGQPLKVQGADGKIKKPADLSEGEIAALAVYSFLESVMPGVQLARRLREGGSTAFDNSTVLRPRTKPNSSYGQSAVNRVFNPVRPTYLRKPKGKASAGGGGAADPLDAVSGVGDLPSSVTDSLYDALAD